MALETDVTADDVRLELDELPKSAVSDAVIEQKIDNAEIIVAEYASADATSAQLEYAVRTVAAYDVLTTDNGGWTTVARDLDSEEQYNVADMVASAEAKRAEALAIVSPDGTGPTLGSVGTRYARDDGR